MAVFGRIGDVWTAVLFIVVLVLSGCSALGVDSGPTGTYGTLAAPESTTTTEAATTTSTTTEPTTTSTTEVTRATVSVPESWPSLEDELIGRYMLYREALVIAAGPPAADFEHDMLDEFVIEGFMESVRANAPEWPDKVVHMPERWRELHNVRVVNPVVVVEEGAVAELQDCWDRDFDVIDLGDESVEETRGLALFNVWLEYDDGEWRVERIHTADERSSGYEECLATGDFG